MREDNRGWTFSRDEALLYIMDSQTRNFLLLKMFIDGLEWCELLVDYLCDVFNRCLDSHSDGTHSLQRILW